SPSAGDPARRLALAAAEVRAPGRAGEEPSRTAGSAAEVEHERPAGDPGTLRQLPDLAGPHEALLPHVIAGRVGGGAGPLQSRSVEHTIRRGHGRLVKPITIIRSTFSGMAETRRLMPALLLGAAGLVGLLGGIAATVGLSTAGWITGLACGAGVVGAVCLALHRNPGERLGPAGWCTLARALAA